MSQLRVPPDVVVGHIRQSSWERLSYGLYAPRRVRTLTEDLRAWSAVLPPTGAFTHLTAAELYGWWLPAAIVHPVFVAVRELDHAARRAGVLACRHPQPVAMRIVDGLRVTTPAETLIAAARDLGALDLVILGDSALRLGHCTTTELVIAAGQRRRGAPLLRKVIPMLDPSSESPWESVMRVLHRAADIDVQPQHEVFDEGGRFVARGDLWIIGTRRLHEYDGAVHREADVHRQDLNRDHRLLIAGWERVGVTSQDLLGDGRRLIASVDTLLKRPEDGRRLLAWDDLVDQSLYGRAGRARAYHQWRRAYPAATSPKLS